MFKTPFLSFSSATMRRTMFADVGGDVDGGGEDKINVLSAKIPCNDGKKSRFSAKILRIICLLMRKCIGLPCTIHCNLTRKSRCFFGGRQKIFNPVTDLPPFADAC